MNLLCRAQGRFRPGREAAVSTLRRATVVASDGTGVRIEGSNAFHWVFHSAQAVVHTASPTRGAVVVREMMDGHRPAVWISDRYTAQQGHATAPQTCLAHLARDVASAAETSDDPVPWRLQLWLRSVFALAERVTDLATSTLAAKRRSLDRQLGAILATQSRCDLTRALQAKIGRARDQLLVFLAHPGRSSRPTTARAAASAVRHPAEDDQRLPRHVGRRGRSRHPHRRRYRAPHRQQTLRNNPQNHRRLKPNITPLGNYVARPPRWERAFWGLKRSKLMSMLLQHFSENDRGWS